MPSRTLNEPADAQLVDRAELWRWCGLWRRVYGDAGGEVPDVAAAAGERAPLAPWPVERPADWLALVNRPQLVAKEESVRASFRRARPFGSEAYHAWTSEVLELASTYRPRGRPRRSDAEVMSEIDSRPLIISRGANMKPPLAGTR